MDSNNKQANNLGDEEERDVLDEENTSQSTVQLNPTPSNIHNEVSKKKSPADAFLDLKDVVNTMRAELYDLKEYSSRLIEVSEHQKQALKEEGRMDGIDSLSRIHQLLFRKVANMDSEKEVNSPYIRQLYENVEGELNGLGVTVISPTLSEPPQYEYMVAVGYIKSSLLHRPNTVSKVESCGYLIKNGNEYKVHKKAEVIIYRKAHEVLE